MRIEFFFFAFRGDDISIFIAAGRGPSLTEGTLPVNPNQLLSAEGKALEDLSFITITRPSGYELLKLKLLVNKSTTFVLGGLKSKRNSKLFSSEAPRNLLA